MRTKKVSILHRKAPLRAAVLAIGLASSAAHAAVTLLGTQYRPDRAFPEHECFWHIDQLPGPCDATDPLGGSLHVFLLNTGPSPVTVQDVAVDGISLELALYEEEQAVQRHPVSIYFGLAHGAITQQQFDTLVAAGEPVWYKADPAMLAPGTVGQVLVRMRQTPVVPSVGLNIITNEGSTAATVPVDLDQPQLAGAYFSQDLSKVYLYWRRTPGGTAPDKVLMDNVDVTSRVDFGCDAAYEVSPSVLELEQPAVLASYHLFQGVYSDGKTASASLRAWGNPFCYGIYGAWPPRTGDTEYDEARARLYLDDISSHMINNVVYQLGATAVQDYLKTTDGQQYAADRGIGFVLDNVGKWGVEHPYLWYIRDEPDAKDSLILGLPADKAVGSLADMCVEHGEELRIGDPLAPTTVNIDQTYKPFNWHNYAQVPDVVITDPYYQPRLKDALWEVPQNPDKIQLYTKATYVYAAARMAESSAEPNPMILVLFSTKVEEGVSPFRTWPFPTPESKRIEAYYALAGGAKGLCYWWYTPPRGVGVAMVEGDPAAQVLWREIGLVGSEARTVGPLITVSSPLNTPLQTSTGLWARALVVGLDSLVVLAANDQYANSEEGTQVTPLTDASVELDLPGWLASPTAFEITSGGVRDVDTQLAGNHLEVTLGPVDLTRMIVVTADPLLRATVEQRFSQEIEAKACALAPEVCAPSIAQQPQSQSVPVGDTAVFIVEAAGTGTLTYQWQKNQVNLSDGGRFSGVTTSTLTVSDALLSDAAYYRCVVTNTYGSDTSDAATLAVTPTQPCDYDGDSDVDQSDFGYFQACVTGAGGAISDPACQAANLDGDTDVDENDLLRFLACRRGASVPADPACLD